MIANVDLIISVVIVFLMVRMQSKYQVNFRIISGVKCFISKQFSDFVRAAAVYGSFNKKKDANDEIPVDYYLTQLNLSMVQFGPTVECETILKMQPFFKIVETIMPLVFGFSVSHVVLSIVHCGTPTLESTGWVSTITFVSHLLIVQMLIQMVFLTGFHTTEMKIGLAYSILVTLVMVLLSYRGVSLIASNTLIDIGLHINSLLMQLSSTAPTVPMEIMTHIVKCLFVLILATFSFAVIIPAFRFTQTLVKMSLGKKSERGSKGWLSFLWLDFLYPVLIVLVFSPAFIKYMNCSSTLSGNFQSCAVYTWRNENVLVLLETTVICGYVAIRFIAVRKHLQSFMDFSVETVSHIIMTQDEVIRHALRSVIELRSRYLISAFAQYLSVPLIFWSLVILLVRSKPLGTGICASIRTMANLDNTPLYDAAQLVLSHNTTQLAMEKSSSPYLEIAFWRAMGAIEKVSKDDEKLPAGALMFKQFVIKICEILPLPVIPAASLLESLIFHFALIWIGINILALLIWLICPASIWSTVSTPKYTN